VTTFNLLEKRIIELSFKHQLTHVSSCLNCVNLIDYIYEQRKQNEPFVLGNSHAALALYVVLEKWLMCDAEELVNKHGTHASRDTEHGIWVSGGSLGQPETVAVGMALADKNRTVWLVTSDGSCMEGATMEAMRVARKYCPNLNIYVVFNGLGAYGLIAPEDLPRYPKIYYVDQGRYPEWLRGLPGHYLKLTKEQYEELMK
jgi:transketolase N-terminal domain/subunit